MKGLKRAAAGLAAAFVLAVSGFSPSAGAGAKVRAAGNTETNFEKTDVLDDLKSVEGFSLSKYPPRATSKPEMYVIDVEEYCYDYRASMRGNYGLYLYVYNPGEIAVDVGNAGNKVQIAVKYDGSQLSELSAPTDFEKFGLKFCSMSEGAGVDRLFYKFKVIDHVSSDGKTIAERVNSTARRYDISGIELVTRGEDVAHEYPLTGAYAVTDTDTGYGSFTFTGFARGYGPDAASGSTLACSVRQLETVQLGVKHTFYRTETSSKGTGFQNQIDSVYFSVPKRLFDAYGKLQRIKAEWYEYMTKPVLVTSNREYYDFISQYIGVDVANVPDDYYFFVPMEMSVPPYFDHAPVEGAQFAWNIVEGYVVLREINPLYYLFSTANWGSVEEYDPYADDVELGGGVSSNRLYEYIKSYDKTAASGYLPIKNGQISADLFEDDINDSRKMHNERGQVQKGYSYYDFDADLDLQEWLTWADTDPSFWNNWVEFGFWDALFGNTPEQRGDIVSPIQVITPESSELKLSDTQLSDELYINYADVAEFRKECNDAFKVSGSEDEEKYVVLFRFAVSDYYSHEAYLADWNDNWWDDIVRGEAYMARQEVYFDFDVIQLSFRNDEEWHVVAAVSDPVDIVNSITPPTEISDDGPGLLEIILAVAGLLLVIFLIYKLLSWLITGASRR